MPKVILLILKYTELKRPLNIDGTNPFYASMPLLIDLGTDQPEYIERHFAMACYYEYTILYTLGGTGNMFYNVGESPTSIHLLCTDEAKRSKSTSGLLFVDNRAVDVLCYHPGYTCVEKSQTIIWHFQQEQASGEKKKNFMRQYNDINSRDHSQY